MKPLKHPPKRSSRLTMVHSLLGVFVGLVAWIVFAGPVRQWWQLHGQVGQLGEKLIAMERSLRRQEQVEAQSKQFEQRILARGTDAEESGLLLKELETLTRAASVKVKSIRSMPSQRIGDYRKFVVSLEIETRVNGMLEMLYAIDSSAKILTVESLTLKALRSGPNLLGASMVVSRTTSGEGRSQPPSQILSLPKDI
ncbi:MAG: GspMb/PilO family protein [Planctomycetota bacterium]